jgi:hypothetical protein
MATSNPYTTPNYDGSFVSTRWNLAKVTAATLVLIGVAALGYKAVGY